MLYYSPQRSGGEECKVPLSREKIGEMESHLEDDDPLSDDAKLHQDYFHLVWKVNTFSTQILLMKHMTYFRNLLSLETDKVIRNSLDWHVVVGLTEELDIKLN